MKIKIISGLCIAGFLACSAAGMAQSLPATADAKTDSPAVDLGFGIVRSLEQLTASTYTISAAELEQTSAINLQDALYGRLLGLTASKNGGFAGDENYGAWFNIRGDQTLGEKTVLILVDGFERPIDRLTVEEVESVTVLKDAAAVALYGYRGINGIISVKTKRGTESGFSITASYDHKYTFDPMIADFVDAPTYAEALNQARANDGLSPAYNAYELNAYRSGTDPLVYPNVDWRKEALRNHGSENRANLSFQGGNDKIKYFTLLNYTDSRGLLNHTENNDGYSTQLKYSKANVRTNLDFRITPTTFMQVNVQGIFYETNKPYGVDANNAIASLYSIPASAFPVKMMDGEVEKWGGNATYGGSNLRALIEGTGYSKNHSRSLFADAKLTQDLKALLPGLSASMRLGYDNYSNIMEDRLRGFEYASERFTFDANGGKTGSTIYRAGNKSDNLAFSRTLQSQFRGGNFAFTLDWRRQYGGHDVAASAIYTTQTSSTDGRYNTFNRANWAAHMHYGYDDRYVADVALVLSGSSRSYPEKFAFSPTASFAWVASNEDFLKGSSVVDLLKLRASAGILHSDYVPRTGISFEDYSGGAGDYIVGYGYSQQWGAFLAYLPTRNFKLETAYKYNVGVDLSMFKGLDLTVDAYFQRRNNILLSADGLNSMVIGIPSSYVNKGAVDSRGIEVALNYNKRMRNWAISAGAIFSYGTNTVRDLIETPAYPYLSRIGKPVNQNFGLEVIGIFADEQDIANSPAQEFDIVRPGDYKYKDQNNDGVINENDAVAIGFSSGIPEINYAFHVGVEFKGIGFNALFQGVANYTKYLGVPGVHAPLVNNTNLSQYYLDNAWQPGADNSNAIFPRLTSLASPNNYRGNSALFADGSFLKLRNCEVYYRLPESLFKNAFIKSIKVYVKGENLLSFSKIKEMDPEVLSTAYPVLKTVSAGLFLKF